MASAMLIVSNRYRLATVLVAKCASTTLISLFARLHDLPVGTRDRRALNPTYGSNGKVDRRPPLIALPHGRIVEAQQVFGDYAWFAVVRDPYGRLLSNYHNKINRFCATFRKDLYLRYKLVQLFQGPSGWRDVRRAMPYLNSRVSYHDFVATLQRGGVDWDPHFMLQADILRLGQVEYARLLRLESLQDELMPFLRQADVPAARLAELGNAGRLNASGGEQMGGTPEELAERPAVHELYREDFTRLGYAA
jgi:hypothetical protein